MNILMFTNTYLPIVGGLELSIQSFTEEFRKRGHRVKIIAPEFDNSPAKEPNIIRVPAFKNFNGSKFSITYPVPVILKKALKGFKPDVIHTHHPFLMGDTALRLAYADGIPLVFTHHSIYEENITPVPGMTEGLKKFIIELSTGYANLCDTVIAPSGSVAQMIREHGVTTPIEVIPTGLHLNQFRGTSGNLREKMGIPKKALVVGYVGRLAEEKNLPFLMRAVSTFLRKNKSALFLVVGSGPMEAAVLLHFKEQKLESRLRMAGEMNGKKLIEAYHAIDVFAFASQSETQGMVLNEAMAAGTPVVGVDAPGVRDIVTDKVNGRLIPVENEAAFAQALSWVSGLPPVKKEKLNEGARMTSKKYSVEQSASKALKVYEGLKKTEIADLRTKHKSPMSFVRQVNAEWDLFTNVTKSIAGAFK